MLVSPYSQVQTLVIDILEKMYPLVMRLMSKGDVRSCQKEHRIRELMTVDFFSILCSSRTSVLVTRSCQIFSVFNQTVWELGAH
jgi:hypothetical protein